MLIAYRIDGNFRDMLQVAKEIRVIMGMVPESILSEDVCPAEFHEGDAEKVANGEISEEEYYERHHL